MVINDFNIVVVAIELFETDPVLIVNANTVLPLPVTMQLFKMICRRDPQITQSSRIIDHHQFSQRNSLYIAGKFSRKLLMIHSLCFGISKCLYHMMIIHVLRVYVKRVY